MGRTAWDHAAAREQFADAALDCYIDWREQSTALTEAVASWCRASTPQRPLAFAAQMAALEQEECAAAVYARSIEALAVLVNREASPGKPDAPKPRQKRRATHES